MATPLDQALLKMRQIIDGEDIRGSHRREMHEALDDVVHEALIAGGNDNRPERVPYELWRLRYGDIEGGGHELTHLPGTDPTPDQLRELARLLIDQGAVEVHLERSVPWHSVQMWKADDLTPGPGCTCPPSPGDGSDEFAPDPQCPQHRDWLPAKPEPDPEPTPHPGNWPGVGGPRAER